MMNRRFPYQIPQTVIMPVDVEGTMCQSGEIPDFGNGGLLGDDLKLF